MNGFDRLAPVYDLLASLVFGKSLLRAQGHFLYGIPESASVLIIGGGTGRIFDLLSNRTDLVIRYVDSSGSMIDRAARRVGNLNVQFICGTQDDLPSDIHYDVVIAPFFFDMFSPENCRSCINQLSSSCYPTSYWLVTDFVDLHWWHRILLWCMYRFFRVTCRIEAAALPDWSRIMSEEGFGLMGDERYYKGFVRTTFYERRIL